MADLFAVIRLFGAAVYTIGPVPGGEWGCGEVLAVMERNIPQSFLEMPYGVMVDDRGTISRVSDWSAACEPIRPDITTEEENIDG